MESVLAPQVKASSPSNLAQASAAGHKVWIFLALILIIMTAVGALFARSGYLLNSFGDLTQLFIITVTAVFFLRNGLSVHGTARAFWFLLALGFAMWSVNLLLWTFYEVWLRQPVPDLPLGDLILFIKLVPLIAALALEPHYENPDRPRLLGLFDLSLLFVYWSYLYVFFVLAYHLAVADKAHYDFYFNLIYAIGNQILLLAVGFVALRTRGPWRKFYLHFFGAAALYSLASISINVAIDLKRYYTGSLYDVPLIVSMCWFAFSAFMLPGASQTETSEGAEVATNAARPTRQFVFWSARLAMLATVSTPVIGLYLLFSSAPPDPLQRFRILTTLIAMLLLMVLLSFKQDFLNLNLSRSLREASNAYTSLQRFKDRLVQSDKLAELGKLVAGVAREIRTATSGIVSAAQILGATPNSSESSRAMGAKIDRNARRTNELVANMLSFAQETPLQLVPVDVGHLLESALNLSRASRQPNVRLSVEQDSGLPMVKADPNQLLQVFLHLITNALDAMEDTQGGSLSITSKISQDDVQIEFADTGSGLKDPNRVFDPFYTTKPVGKGTGLGLSTCYGIVRQHGGEITCHNRAGGGAVFRLILRKFVPDTAEHHGEQSLQLG